MWTVYINDLPAAVLNTPPQVDLAFVNAVNQSPQLFNHILATYNDGEVTIENLLLQTLRIRFETDSWIGAPFIVTGNPTATIPVLTMSNGLTFTVCLSASHPAFVVTPIVAKSAYEIATDQGFQGTVQEWLSSLIGPQGEPADPAMLDDLQAQIREIYDAGGGGASGLLPDETAARVAADEALQQQVNGRLLPVGGSAGQVLAKKSATDFDVEWTESSVGSGTAGTAIPRSVALLMHFDGDTSDLGERTRWENPDGCNFGPGPFGLSLTKDSNQRGIYCGPSSVFNFGTYDFTLEFWIKLASATRNFGSILGSGLTNFTTGSNFLMVAGEQISGAERRIDLGGNSLGTPLLRSASVLPLNEWRHVAITRSNGTIRMFINVVLDASTSSSQEIWFSSGGTWIGSNGWDGPNGFLDGCIAEMRIDKDICRYDSNFVPPSAPYSF